MIIHGAVISSINMVITRVSRGITHTEVAQSCLTLCDPMNRSTPGLPVHHHLPALGDLRYLFRTKMSAVLMNTPKIWFLGIRFLRTALKNQHSLAGVVLQNRQEIDLLILIKERLEPS